jgi:hypothetical protein
LGCAQEVLEPHSFIHGNDFATWFSTEASCPPSTLSPIDILACSDWRLKRDVDGVGKNAQTQQVIHGNAEKRKVDVVVQALFDNPYHKVSSSHCRFTKTRTAARPA